MYRGVCRTNTIDATELANLSERLSDFVTGENSTVHSMLWALAGTDARGETVVITMMLMMTNNDGGRVDDAVIAPLVKDSR